MLDLDLDYHSDPDASDHLRIRDLAIHYRLALDAIKEAEAKKAKVKAELEPIILRQSGAKYEVEAGWAGPHLITVSGACDLHRYDTNTVDALLDEMEATGDVDLVSYAQRLREARKTTRRAASLRMEKLG